eukprot:TRINITY_DN4122_c0_g1_i5.p1 TRINITY_DN4122_c0_g1~~TRINITY_DN4122_c0_g1_i5.p1  ORF type:complete len:398 (+),score=49.57 TRINITY_DN4122_c0_g1_i5:117-1310(+)
MERTVAKVVSKTGTGTVVPLPLLDKNSTMGLIKLQRLIRMWLCSRQAIKRVRLHVQRTKIAFEIYQTEKAYVRNLNTIYEVFYQPLAKNPIIDSSVLTKIFGEIFPLYNLHKELLRKLKEKISTWNYHQTIHEVLVGLLPELKRYEKYTSSFEEGSGILQNLRKSNKSFDKFLQTASRNPRCRQLPLESMLIMPVQRIPRYVLLLKELQKVSPIEQQKSITDAIKSLDMLLSFFNESTRMISERSNSVKKLSVLRSTVSGVGDLQAFQTNFKKEGDAKLLNENCQPKKSIYIFLFEDSLLVAKPISKSKNIIMKARKKFSSFKFSATQVIWLEDYTIIKGASSSIRFVKKYAGKSKKNSLLIYGWENSALRDSWFDSIKNKKDVMEYEKLRSSVNSL